MNFTTRIIGAPEHDWHSDLRQRMLHHLPWKVLGVSAFMWAFFLGYFATLRHPRREVIEMPLLAPDHWVGFEPLAIVPYLSLWVYIGLVPGLMMRWRDILTYGAWAALLCLVGLACFALWPTAVPTRLPPDLQAWGFQTLQGLDAPGNACPSLHVAGTVLTVCWVHHLLRGMAASPWLQVANAVWALAIVWSTMATRQHVVLDVAAGCLLGLSVAWLSLRIHPELGRRRP